MSKARRIGGIGGRAAAVATLAAGMGWGVMAPAMATGANPIDPVGVAASRSLPGEPPSRLQLSATLRSLPIWSATGTLSALPELPEAKAQPPVKPAHQGRLGQDDEGIAATAHRVGGRTEASTSLDADRLGELVADLPLAQEVTDGLFGDDVARGQTATGYTSVTSRPDEPNKAEKRDKPDKHAKHRHAKRHRDARR